MAPQRPAVDRGKFVLSSDRPCSLSRDATQERKEKGRYELMLHPSKCIDREDKITYVSLYTVVFLDVYRLHFIILVYTTMYKIKGSLIVLS